MVINIYYMYCEDSVQTGPLDHRRPDSEMPFIWRFAGGPLMA